MAKRLTSHPKVTVLWNVSRFASSHKPELMRKTVATECKGDGDLLQSLEIKDTKTGETKDLAVNGLFYAIGWSSPPDIIWQH